MGEHRSGGLAGTSFGVTDEDVGLQGLYQDSDTQRGTSARLSGVKPLFLFVVSI